MGNIDKLVEIYNHVPQIFKATRYWQGKQKKIIQELKNADLNRLRSGDYPIFNTFGFAEAVYVYQPSMPFYRKWLMQAIRWLFISDRRILPYSLSLNDIREIAYKRCLDAGALAKAKPISEIEVSNFGSPSDLFQINGKNYTMQFLGYYLRYCFANRNINFTGDEIIVELGSGSGNQIEVLKKLYPNLTFLCFDLPGSLYLCEVYLTEVFGKEVVVGTDTTLNMTTLDKLEKGKIYMFGNWQFPLLKDFNFSVFWNAASFGEMEPHVVKNYLSYILCTPTWIYLLQAEKGKESFANSGVEKPITFNDYHEMLTGYELKSKQEAFYAHRKISQSGGYFEAVWKKR